jgi:hypothetical protein
MRRDVLSIALKTTSSSFITSLAIAADNEGEGERGKNSMDWCVVVGSNR